MVDAHGLLFDDEAAVVHGVGEEAAAPGTQHVDEGGYAALGEELVVVAVEDGRGVAGDGEDDAMPFVELLLDIVEQGLDTLVVAHDTGVEEVLHHGRIVGRGLMAQVLAAQLRIAPLAVGVGGLGGALAAHGVGLVVVEVEEEGEHEGVLSYEFRVMSYEF